MSESMADNRVLAPARQADDDPPPQRRSLRQTVRDMVLSVGVVAAIIFAVMAITWRPQPDPVREVDAWPVAQSAAAVARYPILYPSVAPGWRSTSARYAVTEESDHKPVWYNGWVTADQGFVAIVQARTTNDDFVEEQTIQGRPVRDRTGVPASVSEWDAYSTSNGDQRSLVRQDEGVTTVVTGTLDWAGMADFIDRLEPVPPPDRPSR